MINDEGGEAEAVLNPFLDRSQEYLGYDIPATSPKPNDNPLADYFRTLGGSAGGGSAPNGNGLSGLLGSIFNGNDGNIDIRKIGAIGGGLAGALGAFAPPVHKSGYQGGIPKYTAARNMVTTTPAGSRPGAGGVNYGGDVSYIPKAGATPNSPAGVGSSGGGGSSTLGNIAKVAGGAGLAALLGNYLSKPGNATNFASLFKNNNPFAGTTTEFKSDKVTDPSDSSMEPDPYWPTAPKSMEPDPYWPTNDVFDWNDYSQIEYAKGGIAGGPRYLQGTTDGMADKIPARIGHNQPAALSHGEFVVPADVVSHLGNGNSDAGAKKLYSMMDKIREARTGTRQQGKKINPDSFMPGGLASAYAHGGKVMKFSGTGSSVVPSTPSGMTGTDQAPASWAGEYMTDLLGKTQALSESPYQQYGGPLTAGTSDLQNQAFVAAKDLSIPSSVGQATQTAGDIAAKATTTSYAPTQFDNQFKAPDAFTPSTAPQYDKLNAGTVSSTFQAPDAYQTGTFDNQFKAPTISDTTQFTNQFSAPDEYKNTRFTSGDFSQDQAQKYMNPYLQASLNPQLAEARRQSDISEQQNKAAMTKAGAFGGGRSAILSAENQRNLGTNLADITGKGYNTAFQNAMSQFNADQGRNLQAQQASEQSKQFGAQQSMTAADMQAKYGMSAQQAQEAARQFNQGQTMTAAQLQAQYGLSSQQAQEASRQFGANQAMQGATTAGAQGLQAAMANQQAGLTAGQGNINAAMEAARQQEQSRQFGSQQGMTAAQQAAQYGQQANQASEQSKQFGADLGLRGLQTGLQAAQTQGNLGISSGQLGLAQLQEQAALGGQQRGIEAEGIAADKKAFEEARENPYKMLQFQQSMLNGMPITAQNYDYQQPDWLTQGSQGATTVNKLLETLGLGDNGSGGDGGGA